MKKLLMILLLAGLCSGCDYCDDQGESYGSNY